MDIQGRVFIDFGWFWKPIVTAFRVPRARILVLFSGLFPCLLLTPISELKSGHLKFLKRGFRLECIAKNIFSQKSEV